MNIFLGLLLFVVSPNASSAESSARYQMRGATTYLSPVDTDYGVSRIELVRTASTRNLHWIEFTINSTERVCTRWEQRCVVYDNAGRCVRWEYVCVNWYDRTQPVDKRIQIDFRKASPLNESQRELFELEISRYRPWETGEDEVRTWLYDREVLQPVRVRRDGNWSYRVEVR